MSSNSKSRRSSRSRKKESQRPERPDDLKPVDSAPPNGGETNLLAMMLGMVTSIVLIFGVFGFGSEKIVNEKYDLEQDRRKQERRKADRAATLDELSIKLAELGSARFGNLADTLQACESRVSISEEILTRGASGEAMRQLAVSEGLLARVKLYGLDYLHDLKLEEVGPQLTVAYLPYLDDKNAKIKSTAHVAQLTHRSFEKIRSGNDEVDDLVVLFEDAMNRFQEDSAVATSIEAHLFVLIGKNPEYTEVLYSKLRQRNPVGSLSPIMELRMRNIADRLLLKSSNLDRKFADRWANGSDGRRELTETAIRLLEHDDVGFLLIKRVLAVGNWFERNDFMAEAKTVYDTMVAAEGRGSVLDEFRDETKEYAQNGLSRLALQGQTFLYRGQDSAGRRLDDAEAKKHVGVVVFWSVKSTSSLKYMAELNKSARALSNKPITIYAVCVDDELPVDINVMMRKSPMIRIVDPTDPSSESGKNSFAEQCPPGLLPHVMLIDFGGRVHDINGDDPAKVKNETLALLLNRSRR